MSRSTWDTFRSVTADSTYWAMVGDGATVIDLRRVECMWMEAGEPDILAGEEKRYWALRARLHSGHTVLVDGSYDPDTLHNSMLALALELDEL